MEQMSSGARRGGHEVTLQGRGPKQRDYRLPWPKAWVCSASLKDNGRPVWLEQNGGGKRGKTELHSWAESGRSPLGQNNLEFAGFSRMNPLDAGDNSHSTRCWCPDQGLWDSFYLLCVCPPASVSFQRTVQACCRCCTSGKTERA